MTLIGTLPIVRKSEVDCTGKEIEAALTRIDPEFLEQNRAASTSKFKHAYNTDIQRFPNP
jgi:hypothetical protein